MSRSKAAIAVVVAAALALAGCGSAADQSATPVPRAVTITTSGSTTSGWPASLETGFLHGCEGGADATPASTCECILSQLEESVPLSTVIGYVPGSTPDWLLSAAASCVGE